VLRQVLKAFDGQSVMSASSLAQEVGVQEPLLLQMLDQLVQIGYLEEGEDCGASCADCGQAVMCGASKVQRFWVLTVKGRNFVRGT
jgi:Mn-dependent DtxR family transcriptional regulator